MYKSYSKHRSILPTLQVTEGRICYEQAKRTLTEKQAELNRRSKEIKALEIIRDKCLKTVQDLSLQARKLEHKLKEWEHATKEAMKAKAALMKHHSWIEREMHFFGVVGSDYDFVGRDVPASHERLKSLKMDQVTLHRILIFFWLIFAIGDFGKKGQ